MKPTGGVFAVSRGIFEDPDFADEPFTQREAFMWLVASAAWKQHKTRGAYGPVTLERGEFCFSIRYLAERWQWSKSRVERALNMLKNRDTIRDSKRGSETVWLINKYNDFQVLRMPSRDSERDSERDTIGTVPGQSRDKEESIKSIKVSSLRSDTAPTALSLLSEVLDADHSKAVLAHRKGKKLAVTPYAISLLVTQLKACPDANAAADEMILRGWSGRKAEWVTNSQTATLPTGPPQKPLSAHAQKHADAIRILSESIAQRRAPHERNDENTIDLANGDFQSHGPIAARR